MAQRTTKTKWIRRVAVLMLVPSVLALTAYGWFRHRYPYGFSHCCDLQLGFALREYASTHGGFLPAGEESPEASLGLLYGPWVNANVLRGKTIPEEVVQARLDQGLRLTPETCGWHYVEGLREDDDGQIAVCWDKVGLDHNGGLLPAGDHTVLLLGVGHKTVPAAEWPEFLEQQQALIAASKAARHAADVARKAVK